MKFTKRNLWLLLFTLHSSLIIEVAQADNICRDTKIYSESREVCKLSNGNSLQISFSHKCGVTLLNTEKKIFLKNSRDQIISESTIPMELVAHNSSISALRGICRDSEFVGVFEFAQKLLYQGKTSIERDFVVIGVNQNDTLNVHIEKSQPYAVLDPQFDDRYLFNKTQTNVLRNFNRVYTVSFNENDPHNSTIKFWNSNATTEMQMDHCFAPYQRYTDKLACFDAYSESPNQDFNFFSGFSLIDLSTLERTKVVDNQYRWLDTYSILGQGTKSYAVVSIDTDSDYRPYILIFDYESNDQVLIPLYERQNHASISKNHIRVSLNHLYMPGPVSDGFKVVNQALDSSGSYSQCLIEKKDLINGTKLYLSTSTQESNADIDPIHKCWLTANNK